MKKLKKSLITITSVALFVIVCNSINAGGVGLEVHRTIKMPSKKQIDMAKGKRGIEILTLLYSVGCREGKHAIIDYSMTYGGSDTNVLLIVGLDKLGMYEESRDEFTQNAYKYGQISPQQFKERLVRNASFRNKSGDMMEYEIRTIEDDIK